VKKETLQKRARRFVYRFVIYVEQKDLEFFPAYPACFLLWSKRDLLQNGSYKYAKESMYPCESGDIPRDMSPWETLHCPWYMDFPKWERPFNQWEQEAQK
jgi:hypothetical protein